MARPLRIQYENACYHVTARSFAMELLYRYGGVNQREIGGLMGVDYSSVSVARKRLRDMLAADDKLKKQFHALENALSQG